MGKDAEVSCQLLTLALVMMLPILSLMFQHQAIERDSIQSPRPEGRA